MEEIKTVIERIGDKYKALENLNATDLNSINEKQNEIDTLKSEIEGLQGKIEVRTADMARLEEKKAEAEQFDRSMEEVAPLIDKTEVTLEPTEEVKEEIKEEVQENSYNPFGDLTSEIETKEEPFEFKSNIDAFNAPEEPVAETPVTTEPIAEAPIFEDALVEEEEPVMDATVEAPSNNVGPIFDERGFDISAAMSSESSAEVPNIGLNEMYNSEPIQEDPSMIIR